MYTYKVVNVMPEWSGFTRIPADIEKYINFYADQGWKLSQVVPNMDYGYNAGPNAGHSLIFEREVQ